MKKKNIAILGSTGSIGKQALEVISGNRNIFNPVVLTAQNNAGLLIRQARHFKPKYVVIGNEDLYEKVKSELTSLNIRVSSGEQALQDIVTIDDIDIVLTAMVGFAGLKPTIKAIESRKNIALANKETLVVAGHIITEKAKEHNVDIYPVDSEHSAIYQCLAGEFHNPIELIYLTASGGPFRGMKFAELRNVKKEDALKHPNWEMGCKITIDSASMMNKGLEVIEAKWLFDLAPSQIKVIVHPQSIIHSLVQFRDGSLKAQMGLPDMKLPIQYAFGYPDRLVSDFERFSFVDYPQLSFEKPDLETFRNLKLAYLALEKDGNMPCILNAANEIAVSAFLKDKVSFLQMPLVIEQCMEKIDFIQCPTLNQLCMTDQATRKFARNCIYGENRFANLPC